MHITIDELMDYLACSVQYKFRHVNKVAPPQPKFGRPTKNSIAELYDKALHKNIAFIFHHEQDGEYPALRHVAKKWGHLWIEGRAKQEDIKFRHVSWRDAHENKRKQGWERLKTLWEYYRDNPGTPIMVDYPYTVPIGRHTLEGTIDLVRVVRNENGREEIVMTEFITDEKNAPFLHIHRDWRVTASSYAFRKLMNVSEQKIVYHGIISGKLKNTERQENDFTQLEHLLDTIELMREHNIFYPVFNERCVSCPYQKFCEKGWFDVKD